MAKIKLFEPNLFNNQGSHIIFVHGMLGSNENTWENDEEKFNWPKVMARKKSHLNVWGYDYEAEFSTSILKIVSNFQLHLKKEEFNTGDIVLIGHSFGGLVIKQLIKNMARESFDSSGIWKLFLKRIKGVVFLATPHNGSNHKSYTEIVTKIFKGKNIPSYFKPNDDYLVDLALWYKLISERNIIENFSLYETKTTSNKELKENLPIEIRYLFQGKGLIVESDSASFEIFPTPHSVEKTHISISKPENDEDDEVYTSVNDFIDGLLL